MISITSNFQRLIAKSTVSFLALYYASSVGGDPLDLSQQFTDNRDVITSTMNNQIDSFANNSITPFQISISDEDLEDLQLRLSLSRLPGQLNNISWEYGTDLNYMRELIGYWQLLI